MIYLFTGIETFTWTLTDFDTLIAFCKAHHIDGIQLKVYEITQGEWYKSLGGPNIVINYIRSKGLDVLPYGYFYGVSQRELDYVRYALMQWEKFCMNCETEWDNNPSFAQTLAHYLQGHSAPPTLYISTWANPTDHGWLQNIAILDPIVDVWQPEEYGDNLIDLRLQQFLSVRGKVLPTYSINPSVTVDRILVLDGISIWEYTDATTNTSLLDQYVAHLKGTSPMLWFQYPLGVPFGNPNYDIQFGGSHDMTLIAPPNVPVTALQSGVVTSITSPSWGKQIGVKLYVPVNNHEYMSYLHLSATNPGLNIGTPIMTGTLLGWVGGANNDTQYLGTTNPTGINFLNDPVMSSQVQIGIALMDGPEYGVGSGWATFPPIDMTLDPSSLIDSMKFMRHAFEKEWTSVVPTAMLNSGIANQAWLDYQRGNFRGPALTSEIPSTDWSGHPIILQVTPRGRYEWTNGIAQFIRYP